jgi:hypothetical protein
MILARARVSTLPALFYDVFALLRTSKTIAIMAELAPFR